ncbi:unnamed protein product [Prunus armeniaca]|uniref:Uncharacterized protein n=1 Tax=Prunus armeniaca TaxID=36596 RepID=A0A6J5YCL6_PRUAR|nr:unnamed protein product [Prunus armeniaca]
MLLLGSSTTATQEASWLYIFSFADSYHLRGPPYCQLRCWLCFVSVASYFASNKNTRKVFSEYHNVPVDTHKVFTALVQWGSCGSPSVIHNREVLVRALFVRSLRELFLCNVAVTPLFYLWEGSNPSVCSFLRSLTN